MAGYVLVKFRRSTGRCQMAIEWPTGSRRPEVPLIIIGFAGPMRQDRLTVLTHPILAITIPGLRQSRRPSRLPSWLMAERRCRALLTSHHRCRTSPTKPDIWPGFARTPEPLITIQRRPSPRLAG